MFCEIIRQQNPTSGDCANCCMRESCSMYAAYAALMSERKTLKARIAGQRKVIRNLHFFENEYQRLVFENARMHEALKPVLDCNIVRAINGKGEEIACDVSPTRQAVEAVIEAVKIFNEEK